MTIIQALILGIVQGLTELLPVSSSAHLNVIPWLLGWTENEAFMVEFEGAFDVALHFGTLIAIGIVTLIGLQAIINIAVVTSSMPVTGMALPFFSYGGTSLLILLCGVGVLLNISRACKKM